MRLGIEIRRIPEGLLDSVIRSEHYLHRANTTHPAVHYGFYSDRCLVALQEWSAVFKMVLLRFPFLQHLEIVDNSRFLIRKVQQKKGFFSGVIPEVYNLGTRSLSLGIKKLKVDWREETGIVPKLLITYVDCSRGYNGTVYRAANWKEARMSTDSLYSKGRGSRPTSSKKTYIYVLDKRDFRCAEFTGFTKEFLKANWRIMNEPSQYNYMPSHIRKEKYFNEEERKGFFF